MPRIARSVAVALVWALALTAGPAAVATSDIVAKP
jgi:hypothetical protein